MFDKLKSIISSKNNNVSLDKVKKSTQTADSIISQAVSNAGNISSLTLSKEERNSLLEQRKKIPVHITALKYISITLSIILVVVMLFLKADLDTQNNYFGKLGLNDNTGSKHKKIKIKNTELNENVKDLNEKIESLKNKIENKKYGVFIDEIEEIENTQRHWFTTSETKTNIETGKTETVYNYGLIDSFTDMIEYFEDFSGYKTKYFAKRSKELSGDNWKKCKSPLVSSSKKKQLGCPAEIMYVMKNNIEVKSFNISSNGAIVSVDVNEILDKVFTLGSEFIDMMNSFSFYKNGEIRSFTRREQRTGEDSMALSINLEFQEKEDEDLDDEYFQYFEDWKEVKRETSSVLSNRPTEDKNKKTTRSRSPQ